ncbi:MAG: nicotinate-nucleotide--dimethylbenzimidazole phosphoribosyltransferase [Clostridiales bacterium]
MITTKEALFGIVLPQENMRIQAQNHIDALAIPHNSLGVITELAGKLATITANMKPIFDHKELFVFAGDHGVTAEGVSLFKKEVTKEMIGNFLKGGAAVNVFAENAGAKVNIVDMGVDGDLEAIYGENKIINRKIANGTKNMVNEPAMTRDEAAKAINIGINLAVDAVKNGANLLGTGDMGIGNTTASTAILAAVSGLAPEDITGRGTGLCPEDVAKKAAIIKKVLARRRFSRNDSIGILSMVGGFEIGGIAGLILGAAYCKVPILIDGYISTAGALLAYNINPAVKEYMIFTHVSNEKAHIKMLEYMDVKPLLHLDMRLGEGTGAALAMPLIDAAAAILNKMLTFAQANVTPAK